MRRKFSLSCDYCDSTITQSYYDKICARCDNLLDAQEISTGQQSFDKEFLDAVRKFYSFVANSNSKSSVIDLVADRFLLSRKQAIRALHLIKIHVRCTYKRVAKKDVSLSVSEIASKYKITPNAAKIQKWRKS